MDPPPRPSHDAPDDDELAPNDNEGLRALSVYEEGESISFAYYSEESGVINIETSSCFGHDTDLVIQSFRSAINDPNVVLVSNRIATNGPLLGLLISVSGDADPLAPPVDPDAPSPPKEVLAYKVLKSSAYDLRASRQRITENLHVKELSKQQTIQKLAANAVSFPSPPRNPSSSSTPPPSNHHNNNYASTSFHSLSTVLDFDSPTQTRALGGLLAYLQQTLFRLEHNQIVSVLSIKPSSATQYMKVTPLTLRALHIFSEERHPLIAKGLGQSKEGFSLYSLLNRCSSKLGSKCLRQWMLRPLTNLREINLRQSGCTLLMKPDMGSVAQTVSKLFTYITDVPSILMRMQKCLTKPTDFGILRKAVDAAMSIIAILRGDAMMVALSNPEHVDFVQKILKPTDLEGLANVSKRIQETVDEELTRESNQIAINDGFSIDLDNAKQRFDDLDELLSRVGMSISQRYPEIGELQVIFFPQVGFLVSLTNPVNIPPEFVFTFEGDGMHYFKTSEMYTLDDQEGDLDALIKDTEALIATELEEEILDFDLSLRNTFHSLSELDCVMAFANVAAELNFTRPEVVDDDSNTIKVENGRSPLQELVTEHRFIANDVEITTATPIAMITGPNFSGKSCYMIMVGVLVYLAQIGSFVPCDKAKIAIVDQILVRIASVETCAVPQSTFQIDLTQVGQMLRQATKKSLVLIDEFGKGTTPASGMSVLAAAIDHLSNLQSRVVCTTHFLELFSLNLLASNRGGVQVYKMGVHVPQTEEEDAVPLFKLEKGVASSSDGLLCAKMAGLESPVLLRGAEILSAIQKGKSIKAAKEIRTDGALRKKLLAKFMSKSSWADATSEELEGLFATMDEDDDMDEDQQ